jgi:hypothetical protein
MKPRIELNLNGRRGAEWVLFGLGSGRLSFYEGGGQGADEVEGMGEAEKRAESAQQE